METIGRAKTVLVFDDTAVISSIIVHANGSDSTSFVGQVSFNEQVRKHIVEIVVPIVYSIMEYLGLPKRYFDISVVNLSVTAMMDTGMKISGFSSDVPIFLALLSAALKLPIHNDIVSTGHIASTEGDIKPVQKIPAKVTAIIADSDRNKFIYPDLKSDISLDTLSPKAKQETEDAIINAKAKIKAISVANILDLIQAVIPDASICYSSLSKGYFNRRILPDLHGNQALRLSKYLTKNNLNRFWTVLDRCFFDGDYSNAKRLLHQFVDFHIKIQNFPSRFGYRLKQIIHSLPPSSRRLKLKFPLIPMEDCIKLTQFASKSDHDDISELYDAVAGKHMRSSEKNQVVPNQQVASQVLKNILSEIDEQALAKIGVPIDLARAGFVIDKVIVESQEDFHDIISSFYIHLMRITNVLFSPVDKKDALMNALELLEKAFADKGGYNSARTEAETGIHGGMRLILDIITNQYKLDEQQKHINMVIKDSIDSRNLNEKEAFIKEFMKYIEPHLPEELKHQPPKKYIKHYPEIVRLYIQSMDKVKNYLQGI